jgi:RNA polymerase sigma-70 factor (ECF subfamily)
MIALNANEFEQETQGRSLEHSGVFRVASCIDAGSPDEVLVLGLIADDGRAWREFSRRYERLIFRCITKVTRRFASVVSQDDLQEIYATLLLSLLANDKHKLRSFDPERGNRLSTWIGLLAINCAYDHLRAVRREAGKGTLAEAADIACDRPDAFEQVALRERASIAARAFDGFSDKDRTFALLYFGEGMDPLDIARTMNISVKTVYSKKHKIRSRLESLVVGQAAA